MNKTLKRFNLFSEFLETQSPEVQEAAIKIVKLLRQLPTKKQRAEVIRKVIEKLAKERLDLEK